MTPRILGLGGATSIVTGIFTSPVKLAADAGLSVMSGWIVDGAQAMLGEVVKIISLVSTPALSASWFSATYWRVAGLGLLLTVPLLFAAAVQAILRTDLGLLVRAAFVHLPVAVLSVSLAAPVIQLLLAGTDAMCQLVTSGRGAGSGDILSRTAAALQNAGTGFMPVVVAVVILLAGLLLTFELVIRAAAIYVVVLFLPLGFAAMVWPARRVWIKRMLETLLALILSKFAMVAILSLAVAALDSLIQGASPLTDTLVAAALVVLATLSPWALLKLLPFSEVAAEVGSRLHHDTHHAVERVQNMDHPAMRAAAFAIEPMLAGADSLRGLVQTGADGGGARHGRLNVLGAGGRGTLSGRSAADAGAGSPSGPPAFDPPAGRLESAGESSLSSAATRDTPTLHTVGEPDGDGTPSGPATTATQGVSIVAPGRADRTESTPDAHHPGEMSGAGVEPAPLPLETSRAPSPVLPDPGTLAPGGGRGSGRGSESGSGDQADTIPPLTPWQPPGPLTEISLSPEHHGVLGPIEPIDPLTSTDDADHGRTGE